MRAIISLHIVSHRIILNHPCSQRTSETKAYATGMAAWVASSIMRDYGSGVDEEADGEEEETVMFDDFAQWYTSI